VSGRPKLISQLGATLRHQRELRNLRQADLAERAEVSQGTVARVERGDRAALPMVEKLFAALGLQVRIEVEPLDAQIDTALAKLAAKPIAEHIAELRLAEIADQLVDLPFAFDGATAALLQGAPIPGHLVHLAMEWSAADAFTTWLEGHYGQRWHDRWEEYGYLDLHPSRPGAHRWSSIVGQLTVRLVDVLPATIEVRHGERSFRVVPLADVEIADADTARLLQRRRVPVTQV
jgi:transcriptional regulator with XRE-family HTH domain